MASVTVMTPPPDVTPIKSTGRYKIVPCRADLVPEGEVLLPGLWKQLHDEGIFEMFFHDLPDMTFGHFVKCLSNPEDQIDAVVEVNEEGNIINLCAISLLNQIFITPIVKRGVGNFLLFRKYWDHKESSVIGRVILDYWFGNEKANLSLVVGITPKLNRAALSFVHRMGFKSSGEIPDFCAYKGELCPGVVTRMTRSEWEGKA